MVTHEYLSKDVFSPPVPIKINWCLLVYLIGPFSPTSFKRCLSFQSSVFCCGGWFFACFGEKLKRKEQDSGRVEGLSYFA